MKRLDGSKSYYETMCRIGGICFAVSFYLALVNKVVSLPAGGIFFVLGGACWLYILYKKGRIEADGIIPDILYRSVGHITIDFLAEFCRSASFATAIYTIQNPNWLNELGLVSLQGFLSILLLVSYVIILGCYSTIGRKERNKNVAVK